MRAKQSPPYEYEQAIIATIDSLTTTNYYSSCIATITTMNNFGGEIFDHRRKDHPAPHTSRAIRADTGERAHEAPVTESGHVRAYGKTVGQRRRQGGVVCRIERQDKENNAV
jgi:hypothetical protein